MKIIVQFLILTLLAGSCNVRGDEFFDVKHLRNHLMTNYNVDIDKSINIAHNLSQTEVNRIEEDIEIRSDFSFIDSLFYKELQTQISNSDIKLDEASKYLSDSFNRSTLKHLYESGELTKKDYNDIDNYITFIEKEFSQQPFHSARMTLLNIHNMKTKGVLSDLEYRELIMVNHLLFIIDHENG